MRYSSLRNQKSVLSELVFHGPLSRTVIAERVGLTQASVSRITKDLMNAGLVEESDQPIAQVGPGRNQIGVQVRSDSRFVAGIAINAFQQNIVLSNLANETVSGKRLDFTRLDCADEVLQVTSSELIQLINRSEIEPKRLIGCGIVLAGAVDPVHKTLRFAPTIGWSNVNIGESLNLGDHPLVLENIPNAKNLAAYYYGPARGKNNVVLLNCSLAIGTSLLVEGKLLRGHASSVGLVESMLIPDEKTGELKPIDAIAGGLGVIGEPTATIHKDGRRLAQKLTGLIAEDGSSDCPIAQRLTQAGRALGYAVMVINSLLHPELVLLSGPMINSRSYRKGVLKRVSELIGEKFAETRIEFFGLFAHDAAHSLAIHQFLTQYESTSMYQI